MGLQRASILNRDVTWARKANYLCQPLYMFCKNFILKEQLNIEKMSTISDGQGSKHHCEEVAKENKFWN